MHFPVKGICPNTRKKGQKDVSQFAHNKLRDSNYTEIYKKDVNEDFWEHYL